MGFVKPHPVSQQVRPEFAIVSAAGSQPVSHFVIVEIGTEEGIFGFGEASVVPVWSGESQHSAVHAIAAILGPVLIVKDPLEISALADGNGPRADWQSFHEGGRGMALPDLAGKLLGVPACVLAGGPRRAPNIRLKFSIGFVAGSRRKMDLEQWTVAGGGFGLILMWLLMAGEIYTTFAFLGASGWAYSRGGPALYIMAYLTLGYVVSFFILPHVWKAGRAFALQTQSEFFLRSVTTVNTWPHSFPSLAWHS